MKRNCVTNAGQQVTVSSSSNGPSSSRSPKGRKSSAAPTSDEGSEEEQAQGGDYHLVRASYCHVYGVRQTEDLSDLRVLVGLLPLDRASGLLVTSRVTRLICGTSLVMRVEIRASRSSYREP